MRFTPNEDQEALLSAVAQMMQDSTAAWRTRDDWGRYDWAAAFDALLEAQGVFDAAAEETIGLLGAGLLVIETARLPVLVEAAASSLLRPYLGDLPRPLAVVVGDLARPVRFLPVARAVVHIEGERVRVAHVPAGSVPPAETLFAYPMGYLPEGLEWRTIDAPGLDRLWQVATALEMVGALQAGVESVVAHVTDRRQFGRPLGAFQAVQHRLAEAAVKVEGARWLALRALAGDGADAALALGYVQQATQSIVYDLHQFMGASGLTLEHPLHRWTYRLRLLGSAYGGGAHNLARAARATWGEMV